MNIPMMSGARRGILVYMDYSKETVDTNGRTRTLGVTKELIFDEATQAVLDADHEILFLEDSVGRTVATFQWGAVTALQRVSLKDEN